MLVGGAVMAATPAAVAVEQSVSQCVVVAERAATPRRLIGSAAGCATRLSPASTYKIPHALIGLETGAVTPATVERWDGTRYPNQPKWNQDHTVLSAMRPSVLWFFQRMAPRIGAAGAHEFLARWHYGNADASGPIDRYWVNGRLRISSDEQLAFLSRFYGAELGVSPLHRDAVERALDQDPGTVENARGMHKLNVTWREGLRLNSKTGAATIANGESVSWLVGRFTVDGVPIVFASAVWRSSGGVDTVAAVELAAKAFRDSGLLAARR